jgi:hypothetical protein
LFAVHLQYSRFRTYWPAWKFAPLETTTITGSSTWRDVREQDDTFHDELIDALVEKPETRKVNPPYGLWRAGAISIVGILACNHAESPMGSAMGGFTNRAMMEWCR